MQFQVTLFSKSPIRLDFSYYPKMAAAIYQSISFVDSDFAHDLHDGETHRNRIKLFGFSPLHSRKTEIHPTDPALNQAGGLIFKGICSFRICSPLPELINRLWEGLLQSSVLRIGSQLLEIRKIEQISVPSLAEKMIWRLHHPASCVTTWSQNDEKQYALPGAPADGCDCAALLRGNLLHKWRRLQETRPDIAEAWLSGGKKDIGQENINTILLPLSSEKKAHKKRYFIKNAPVLSWIAPVQVTAPLAVQRLIWACGLGEMNSMGFGVVEAAP